MNIIPLVLSNNKNVYTVPFSSGHDGKITKLSQSNYKFILVFSIKYWVIILLLAIKNYLHRYYIAFINIFY